MGGYDMKESEGIKTNDIRGSQFGKTLDHYYGIPRLQILPNGKKSQPKMPEGWKKLNGRINSSSPNILVHTGSRNGIIVFDVDGPIGLANFKRLVGCHPKEMKSLCTMTIRNGYHLYFPYDSRITTKHLDILKFDFQSDNTQVYEGDNYPVIYDGELGDPELLYRVYQQALQEEESIKNINRMTKSKQPSEEGMKKLLTHLDSNTYLEKEWDWFLVANSLKHIGYSLDFIQEWSKQSTHYNPDNFDSWIEKQWAKMEEKKIKNPGFGHIQRALYISYNNELDKVDEIIKETLGEDYYNTNTIGVKRKADALNILADKEAHSVKLDLRWCKAKIKEIQDCKDRDTAKAIEKILMDNLNQFIFYIREDFNYYVRSNLKDDFKPTRLVNCAFTSDVFEFWKTSLEKREYKKVVFIVKESKLPSDDIYNQYIRPDTNKEFPGSLQELERIAPLFCRLLRVVGNSSVVSDQPVDAGFNFMIHWTAKVIQEGKSKQGIALLGTQGCGKGTTWELLGMLIGEKYVRKLENMDHLNSRFNADLESSILTILEEVSTNAGSYHKTNQIIKKMVTDVESRIEHKNGAVYQIQDQNNIVMNTNGDNPILIESGQRRFFPSRMSPELTEDLDFFTRVREEVFDSLRDIRGFFYNFQYVSELKTIRPKTTCENELEILNRDPAVSFIMTLKTDKYHSDPTTRECYCQFRPCEGATIDPEIERKIGNKKNIGANQVKKLVYGSCTCLPYAYLKYSSFIRKGGYKKALNQDYLSQKFKNNGWTTIRSRSFGNRVQFLIAPVQQEVEFSEEEPEPSFNYSSEEDEPSSETDSD